MMTEFDFQTAERIIFGTGKASLVGDVAAAYGQRLLLVTGTGSKAVDFVKQSLQDAGLTFQEFIVKGEPSIEAARQASLTALETGCELVVGCGGGSALDTAKAAAAFATNPGDPKDYLEVVGKGRPLGKDPLPVIALPTTAGTGSEVTRNAVLSVPDQAVKVSLRHARMLPKVAIVDPQLTLSVPAHISASTGMDALTQVIEPYVSLRANAMTDMFCAAGIQRAGRALLRAYTHGEDLRAREDMSFCSLMGGLALANSGLGAVHGFAAPIGGLFAAPHGAVCARLLPVVCKTNLQALRLRQPGSQVIERYRQVAAWAIGNQAASADDLINWLEVLIENLQIPRLKAYGIRQENFEEIVEKTPQASSFKANPIKLEKGELISILEAAF